MVRINRWSSFMLTITLAAAVGGTAAAQPRNGGAPKWRVEFANDVIFDSDNQFTNGFSVQRHSKLFDSLEQIRGLPVGRWLARRILPDRDGLFYRNGFTIGHNMQTPDDIENPNLILNDVPYVGMLGGSNTWVAYNDRRFAGFEVLLGLVGEESLAEELQSAVHDVIDSEDPNGWDNQLDTEPILNFYYMWKHKLWRNPSFDSAVSLDLGVGNFVTGGSVALETRFGRMPEGFSYVPSPLGAALHYDAILPDRRRTLLYGSVVARMTGHALSMSVDGNTFVDDNPWTENNAIEPEETIGVIILGLHFVRPRWGLHANWWLSTDTVESANFAAPDDPTNNFGTFVIEWSF